MDPDDMGVAPQHAAAVREAVGFAMQRKHRSINRRRSSIDALSMLSRDSSSPTHVDADSDGRPTSSSSSDKIEAGDVKQV